MATATAKSFTTEFEERTAAEHVVLHEDENTRMIHYVIKPGEQTGWHTHEYDYTVFVYQEEHLHLILQMELVQILIMNRAQRHLIKLPWNIMQLIQEILIS